MENTKKRNQYEFDKRKYDHAHIQLPKGRKAVVQDYAASNGESLNGYINRLIEDDMKKAGHSLE